MRCYPINGFQRRLSAKLMFARFIGERLLRHALSIRQFGFCDIGVYSFAMFSVLAIDQADIGQSS